MPARGTGLCDPEQSASRVSGDLELCCSDPTVQTFTLGVGIPAVLIYAIGIPISAAALLACNKARLDDKHVRATLGFLYAGYRTETFYWEAVVMLRKALVAGIAVFLAPAGPAIQTYAALLLMFALAVLQVTSRPFKFEALNRLELWSLISAFMTFVCGLFLTDSHSTDGVKVLATLVIFTLNIVTLLGVMGVALSSTQLCSPERRERFFGCIQRDSKTSGPTLRQTPLAKGVSEG